MSEMANTDPEGIDGVRMTWNVWPRTKVEASKCVIPLAASIAPIRSHPDIPSLPYAPLRCKTCTAALNAFCRVDFTAKIWICPFCYQRNHFPPHYAAISETNLPCELYPQYTTVQYALPQNIQNPNNPVVDPQLSPVFVFVLDTCMIEEEMGYVRSALKQAIGLLPDNAMVGFVSFGTQAHVHELGFSDMSKVYVFQGSKEISKEQVLEQLGLATSGRRAVGGYQKAGPNVSHNPAVTRFLLPASECEYTLSSVCLLFPFFEFYFASNFCPRYVINTVFCSFLLRELLVLWHVYSINLLFVEKQLLDELQPDQWPVAPRTRPSRCTGVALSVAAGLLGACMPGTGARIVALVGGPCTEGPGTVNLFFCLLCSLYMYIGFWYWMTSYSCCFV